MTNTRRQKCKTRLPKELSDRVADLRKLWKMYCGDSEAHDEDLGHIYEYGLSFDYVASGTFDEQKEGYFRYQISWGGPSDEFRIFVNPDFSAHRIEYWFMDWFDGSHIVVDGENLKLLEEIYGSLFVDSGTAEVRYAEATQDGGQHR
jgi:hypothetical protein